MSAERQSEMFGWQIVAFRSVAAADRELVAYCRDQVVTGTGRYLLLVVKGPKGNRTLQFTRHATLKAAKQARDASA